MKQVAWHGLSTVIVTIGIAVLHQPQTVHADPSVIGTVPERMFASTDTAVRFVTDFPGGKIDRLVEYSPEDFEIVIKPEAESINDSAWYAFRIESNEPRTVKVRLRYIDGSHRYEPKISTDRVNWEPADHLITSRHPGGREVTLSLSASPKPVWIAGQELLSNKDIAGWIEQLQAKHQVRWSKLGESVLGRPIHKIAIGNEAASDSVFLLSRQHPPEVSGTIGLQFFIERLLSDDELAKQYRESFETIAVPVANPDGVARGYWRTNANGVDLNRDWQFFDQPETKSIRDELVRLNSRADGRLWLFLDFHSTYEDLFYTPPKSNELFPEGFTTNWLDAIDKRTPRYTVIRDANHNAHQATSKVWVANNFGIHAITYEFGDETDRELIRRIAAISAEEMMRELLKQKQMTATMNP